MPHEAVSAPTPPPARKTDAEVDALFVERWSQRTYSDRPLSETQLRALFEAARWAPSASNLQPWLFVFARTGEDLERLRPLLKETNQRWAARAPLLVFVFARRRHPETGAPIRTAQFDTGAAWQSLALQAHKLGLSTRAMGGIHHDLTYEALGVPREDYESMVAVAVGHPGELDTLPEDLRAREKPNTRRSASEFVFEGRFQAP